ncbi:D-glycerate dehydrogenase [Marivita sp. XM-24bin2]|uniref:2-hydroxyacid dehydrogenase n=1 Tax=unclassified Marivita TaxID=2632480 RepID=UPI000D7B5553|nr:D-glycerate dehydrogenase [Marivita sp. XM-24bin2]MCR9108203.1 D-glycerate dehydrogenase [Paracoccaceae bacterium]PWL37246.1 MAG: D-glycerate dehydrogenase [Marivita sp. XM-24bin2]
MKLLITRKLPDAVLDRAREVFDVTVRDNTAPLNREELIQSLSDYDVVLPTLGDAYSADIFDSVPDKRTKLLANFGVGYNHIDAAAARTAGIEVTNTPGAVTDATADIALTLMLMTCRRAGEGERMVRAGQWEGWHPTQLLGLHMSGKMLGVVGMGRIGQAIAQRAHFGFGMSVKYYNRSPKEMSFPAEQISDLRDLAAQVDVMVIAVPGGADTHHLIDASVLNAMKPHAHVVNIARGDVVKEADLIAALSEGRIAGAGLDVYEFEPRVPQALIDMENVTLLPHLGTAALEVRTAMGLMAVDNAIAFEKGHPLPNPV